jgi:hypothetical protein
MIILHVSLVKHLVLTLFYTRDLGIVILHVMDVQPYRFPPCRDIAKIPNSQISIWLASSLAGVPRGALSEDGENGNLTILELSAKWVKVRAVCSRGWGAV